MATIIKGTKMVDGIVYETEVDADEDAKTRSYISGQKVMADLGIRLDSYSARVEQGNCGPMGAAMSARNNKNGQSSNQRRANKAVKEQSKINREYK